MNAPVPRWSKAATPVWALVSGLPERRRNRQLLAMLQVFIDESVSKEFPVYAMAGPVATAEQWAKFSDEWQAVLDMPLKLDYFKMSEAMSCIGQFAGFSEERRDERVQMFADVLNANHIGGIACCLPHNVYKEIFVHPGIPKYLQNPYLFLLFGILQYIPALMGHLKLEDDVDVIFDDQMGAKDRVMNSWEALKTLAPYLTNPPAFRNDQKTLPLQGADMIAWVVRKKWEGIFDWRTDRSQPDLRPPRWRPKFKMRPPRPSLEWVWNEKMLMDYYGRWLALTANTTVKMTLTAADGSQEVIEWSSDAIEREHALRNQKKGE